MSRGKILLVDDEIEIREFLKDYFEDREFNVDVASDGVEALEQFKKQAYDLVVTDMMMPGMLGIQVLEEIKKAKPDQRVIFLTGVKETSLVEKAKALGCQHYLFKPIQLTELEARVSECFPS